MKLAYLIYRYGENAGGVERYVYTLASAMLKRGHAVHLFTAEADQVQPGIELHRVRVNRLCSATKVLSFARGCEQMLAADPYDIVHGFSRTVRQDIYRIGGGSHMAYLEATHRSARTAVGRAWLRLNPRHAAILSLERQRYRPENSGRLTAISEIAKQEIVNRFGVDPAAICVIINPVDTLRFSPQSARLLRRPTREHLGINSDRPVALFVGSGFQRKGLHLAIAALARLASAERPYLMVAGRDDPRQARAQAVRLGVEPDLVFCGPVQAIETLYGAADYFLFPSLSDAFGQSVLEAMACGLPAVVSGLAGSSEIIDHGQNGFVLPDPHLISDWVDRIRQLADPARRAEMSAAAAATAALQTVARNVEQTLALYEAILAERAALDPMTVGGAKADQATGR